MGDTRIGKVSSIDYATGMLRVTYQDKGKSVTRSMPCLNYGQEYKMPQIGQSVLVEHLSNGASRGVVVGTIWNKGNLPAEGGKGVYRKELSGTPGRAYQRYDDAGGTFALVAPAAELSAEELKLMIQGEVRAAAREMLLEIEEKITMAAQEINLEDADWSTTLGKIMERLEALDGDSSDKK